MADMSRKIDEAALEWFTEKMRCKLSASRQKGRDGWQDPDICSDEFLAGMFVHHLAKTNAGNFIDIAILAMMLQEREADPGCLQEALASEGSAEPWRPITEAVKHFPEGSDDPIPVIWAQIRKDLVEHTGREEHALWAGCQTPLRHPGIIECEGRTWDHGWSVAAPVGHGGIPDDWIAGWVPLRGGVPE